jgi:hypothetical protein
MVEIIGSRRLTINNFINENTVTGVRNAWYNILDEA